MNVIDYTNKDFENIQFSEETIIIMAHRKKIITFNDHEEMWKIKHILEEISDSLKNDNTDDYYDTHSSLRSLVDPFEEEAWFLEEKDINPRNLILEPRDDDSFDSKISFYFGYLNSSDTFLEPKEYKIIADYLLDFANNSGRCKESTKELLVRFTSELLSEYQAYESNQPYFKVVVIND